MFNNLNYSIIPNLSSSPLLHSYHGSIADIGANGHFLYIQFPYHNMTPTAHPINVHLLNGYHSSPHTLPYNDTSHLLCYQLTRLLVRTQRCKLGNWMLTCQPNGTCNTRQHADMSRNVSPLTWCMPSAFWFGGHGVEIHGEQDICQRMEWRHQYWRRGGVIDLDRARILRIWRRCFFWVGK